MYQLYAYGNKYMECREMFLIYPKSEERLEEYQYFFDQNETNDQLNLKLLFFDLKNGTISEGG